MKIRKYLLAIVAIAAGLTLSSCDKMLETKNFTDMSPGNFFKSEGDFDAALMGLYLPCTTTWGYSDGGTGGWYLALYCANFGSYYTVAECVSDIMRPYSTSDYTEFNIGPAYGGLNTIYHTISFVARATDVINRLENSDGATAQIRERYIAEAKTLRAFYMYVLYDWFGPVNVKLDPETLMDNTIEPRPSKETYVAAMLRDLQDAIGTASFPDKYNGDPTNWGRMSKAIARALLMRVNLHEKDWSGAKAVCQDIMGMGFKIIPSYEDVFNQTITDEHIWSVPANAASDNYYVAEVLPSDFLRGYNHQGRSYSRGGFSGWQQYTMYWDFYDTFDDNDVRKQVILCEYDTKDGHKDRNSGMPGAIPLKFTDTEYPDFGCLKAQPIIRYAEVLLSFAEAENELNGPTAAAVSAVKQVMDRAGLEIPASATASKEAFRDYLLLERGHELFGEGERRTDLIRFGKFIESARERGHDAKDHQVLFPIPSSIIIEGDGIIEQNPGY